MDMLFREYLNLHYKEFCTGCSACVEKCPASALKLERDAQGYYVEVEHTIADGRIDMIAKTNDYIYIFEFKYDKSAEEALRQIDEKGYAKPFASDPRKVIKIGVNFSKEKRCIDGWKIAGEKV